jgi:uncharacterized peroxidase-related enzyme
MNDRMTRRKSMQTIQPIQIEDAGVEVKRLLQAVNDELGFTPNMVKSMAQSPAALEGYLRLHNALAGGKLDPKFREQLALAIAQANCCEYSLAAHTTLAGKLGVTRDEIQESREARSTDRKTDAGLSFARDLVGSRGDCSLEDLRQLRYAGYSDGEIVEIIANIALNIYTNYFNIVASPDIDFPKVALDMKAA